MITKELILERLGSSKSKLRSEFGLERIALYGSYASGKQTEASDIDLLYELKQDKKMSFRKLTHLESFLRQLLNDETIELVNSRYVNPIIQADIEKYLIYV